MMIQLCPASWELLAKLNIDATTPTTVVPPHQVSAYIAAIYWLTDHIEDQNSSVQAQINAFVQACRHFCGIGAWQEVWKVLSAPLFMTSERTLADQLATRQLGREQIELYSQLAGRLDQLTNGLCHLGLGLGYYNHDSDLGGHEAQRYLQSALTTFVELGATEKIAWTLKHLGVNALYALENPAQAQVFFTQAVTMFRQTEDAYGLFGTLHNLADIFNRQGCYGEAHALYRETLDILDQGMLTVNVAESAWFHLTYSQFLLGQGELDDALYYARCSVRIFRKMNHQSGLSWSLIHFAKLLIQLRRYWLAEIVLHLLTESYCNLAEPNYNSAIVYHNLGWYRLMKQDYLEALRAFQAMLTISSKRTYLIGIGNAVEGAAFIAFALHQDDVSTRLFGAVDAVRQRGGGVVAPYYRKRNEQVFARLRESLGGSTFQIAWQFGESMTDEEAFAIVMGISPLNSVVARTLP